MCESRGVVRHLLTGVIHGGGGDVRFTEEDNKGNEGDNTTSPILYPPLIATKHQDDQADPLVVVPLVVVADDVLGLSMSFKALFKVRHIR